MEALKNLFDKALVIGFAQSIKKYDDSFDDDGYIKYVLIKLDDLELKERMRLISSSIHPFLKTDYCKTLSILKKVKKNFFTDDSLSLQSMLLPDYVEVYGLEELDASLEALEYFTIASSSEFAIRHFIIKYEEQTMKKLLKWSKSENEHIKRLASEGCRPRLPWAIALPIFKKDPTLILDILNELKNDDSLYVRRSVANNLNDIAKDNPNIVIDFVRQNLGLSKECDWLLKHASRTLFKKGNQEILNLFGYRVIKDLVLRDFLIANSVNIGEYLAFSFSLKSKDIFDLLRIEYEIDFKMSKEKRSKKVYMISQSNVQSNSKNISKKHSFKVISTRKYYRGMHYLTIIVNGHRVITKPFTLN